MTFEEQFVKEITPIIHDIAERIISEAIVEALAAIGAPSPAKHPTLVSSFLLTLTPHPDAVTINPEQERYKKALERIMDFHSPTSDTHKCAKNALDGPDGKG